MSIAKATLARRRADGDRLAKLHWIGARTTWATERIAYQRAGEKADRRYFENPASRK